MDNNITINQVTWRGIIIEVSYFPKKWNSIAHIEVRSIKPEKAQLPITETGYKSHFLPIGVIESYNMTATDFVMEWLDRESQTAKWKNLEEATKQLSLF